MAGVLVAPMEELFERYRSALARWPQPAEGEEEIRFSIDIEGQAVEVADWLGGIRSDGEGRRGRVVLESSDVVKDRRYRGDRLIRHWVSHLAAHLAGGPLTTMVVSKKGDVELKPLETGEARAHATELMKAWQAGMRRPLPLAARTAFAWLGAKADPASAARTEYEGAHMKTGEVETCAYLRRAYPSFDALVASGEFAELAATLLGPLQRAIPVEGKDMRAQQAAGAEA